MSEGLKALRHLVFPALILLCAAAGCGQKGPLYLPDNPSEMQTVEPAADAGGATADGEEDDDTDNEQ